MKKITKIEAVVESGLGKVPPEIRERILTKVQARAFVRGYIQFIDIQQEAEEDPLAKIDRERLRGRVVSKLHELS